MDRWKDGKRGREWRNERIERLRKRRRGGKRERDEYREGWVKGGKVGGGMERWMADAVMGQRKGWRDGCLSQQVLAKDTYLFDFCLILEYVCLLN